jgi:hypothetical protein
MTAEIDAVMWDEALKSAQLRKHWRIAERLADEYASQLLYVVSIGWHYWDGHRWARDERGHSRHPRSQGNAPPRMGRRCNHEPDQPPPAPTTPKTQARTPGNYS